MKEKRRTQVSHNSYHSLPSFPIFPLNKIKDFKASIFITKTQPLTPFQASPWSSLRPYPLFCSSAQNLWQSSHTLPITEFNAHTLKSNLALWKAIPTDLLPLLIIINALPPSPSFFLKILKIPQLGRHHCPPRSKPTYQFLSHMSLQTRHDLIERQCKIRKRGCSSSSSSSLVRRYRLKRAILVGKRAGSSTPVPTWKTSTSPRSPATMPKKQKGLLLQQHSKDDGKGKEVMSVSARKLAATMWEINEVNDLKSKESKMREEEGVPQMPPKLPDPSYSPISEVTLFCLFFNLSMIDIALRIVIIFCLCFHVKP